MSTPPALARSILVLLLAGMLSACATPRYQTVHRLEPPADAAGLACIEKCSGQLSVCQAQCAEAYQVCVQSLEPLVQARYLQALEATPRTWSATPPSCAPTSCTTGCPGVMALGGSTPGRARSGCLTRRRANPRVRPYAARSSKSAVSRTAAVSPNTRPASWPVAVARSPRRAVWRTARLNLARPSRPMRWLYLRGASARTAHSKVFG